MAIILFFIAHWYFSLFFQSFFNHRYAAHQMFTMSPFWEKVFWLGNFIANGSSYLSPRAYGILHRMHHAFADTEKDPHSPKYDGNIWKMMLRTRDEYLDVFHEKKPIEARFKKNIPTWEPYDHWFEHIGMRVVWIAVYVAIYAWLATAWWQWLFLPLTVIMGPLHGAIINWFAHKIGYTNFEVSDTSKNIMPLDIFMLGEGYHNNHHKRGSNPNFGYRWYELDPIYPFILLFNAVGIIRLKKSKKTEQRFVIHLPGPDLDRIKKAFSGMKLPGTRSESLSESQISTWVEKWDRFVKQDWSGDMSAYLKDLQVRRNLQVILDNVSESARASITKLLEPIDSKFKERMRPVDPSMAPKLRLAGGKHFWETHWILQA